MVKKFDFIISGGGLVGCVIASALSKLKYKCCLIEKDEFTSDIDNKSFNPLSLNYRSKLILDKFGLWKSLVGDSNPINTLTIKHTNNLSRVKFRADEANLSSLGYVMNRITMQNNLRNYVLADKNISLFANTEVKEFSSAKGVYDVSISNQKIKISSPNILVCDTSASKLAKYVCPKREIVNYDQTSLVINVSGVFDHSQTLQYFTMYGILAFIPYDKNTASIVLTLKNKYLPFFLENNKLNESKIISLFRDKIKNMSINGLVGKYEMKTSRASNIERENILLLGNSSYLIHTVGAQGYNLALKNIETVVDYSKANFALKNKTLDSLTNTINNDRHEVFENVDFAINTLSKDGHFSKLLSKSLILSLNMYPKLKYEFIKKIIGLNNYSYLSVDKL